MLEEQEENVISVDFAEENEAAQVATIMMSNAEIADVKNRLAQPGLSECEDCEDAIPTERREAYPAARRCVFCQELHERTYARR